MSVILNFFTWLWDGIKAMFHWLVSLPTILLSSFTGLVVTIYSILVSLRGDSDTLFGQALQEVSAHTSEFAIIQQAPDIVKAGLYALSIDVLFNYVFAAFVLFLSATAILIEFWLVSFLTFVIAFYGIKIFGWLLAAFVPKFALPGITGVANADIPKLEETPPIDV